MLTALGFTEWDTELLIKNEDDFALWSEFSPLPVAFDFREIRRNDALHAAGLKIVYHLCGGVMKMLDLVVESGADGLETMTPPSMGGSFGSQLLRRPRQHPGICRCLSRMPVLKSSGFRDAKDRRHHRVVESPTPVYSLKGMRGRRQ